MSQADTDNALDFAGQSLDYTTQVISGGTVGYDYRTGKLKQGLHLEGTLHALDEGLGEISGRNLMREQMHQAQARLLDEQAAREQELANQRAQAARADIQASRSATRRSRASSSRSTGGAGGDVPTTPLGAGQDFLGL